MDDVNILVYCPPVTTTTTTNVSKDVGKMESNRDGDGQRKEKNGEKITEKRQQPQLASFYIQIA